jgi:ABC-type multidrug transport system fused ATPase/permease subunit
MKYVKWFLASFRGIKLNTFVRILVGLGQTALGLFTVWLSKIFIDETIVNGSDRDVYMMVAYLFATAMCGILLRQLYFYLTVKAEVWQTNNIRQNIFTKLFYTPLFENKTLHSGDVTSRLTKDIELVSQVSTDVLPHSIIIGVQLLGAFLLMRHFDSRLAWLLVIATPLVAATGKFITHRLKDLTLAIRNSESEVQMQVQESIEQNAVLRSLCCESYMAKKLFGLHSDLMGKVMKRTRFTVIVRLLLGITFGFGYLTAFVWGGLQLRSGEITFGTMTSFLQLVGLIQSPVLSLLNMLPQVIQSTASIDRLEEMEGGADVATASDFPFSNVPLGVNIQDVTFGYKDGEDIISNFSFDFAPGSKTAIVGRTGIGKTTLFRLMLSFVKPSAGSITVYDINGKAHESSESLRPGFVFVPQGNTLISGTIRYNLLLADPDAPDEKLRDVLHVACADFIFDLPCGLDTVLSEKGGGLSEGQAQRIAIARGLLRPGQIFLLDEISSALDEATEREMFKRMVEAYPSKTMIFITHRMEVVKMCGAVVEL